ncbi:MAG: hypothetical protein Q4C87_07700 [Actinomycetaceae bacterium]|nr:hypothetical protein [Actinomycetaceae bacterium]
MNFRPELLTLEEALGGNGVLDDSVHNSELTICGPEKDLWSSFSWEYSNVAYFTQSDRWFTLGVFNKSSPEEYEMQMKEAAQRLHGDLCLLGRKAAEEKEGITSDWRMYPLDFGQSVVAYRAVAWSIPGVDVPPSAPVPQEGLRIRSTARAMGVVDGYLVKVHIDQYKPEPPYEEELRALWDAQSSKVRYLAALERNKTASVQQSGSIGIPANE